MSRGAQLAVLALLAYDVGAACTSSTLSGYTCQTTSSTVVVHYALAADKATVKLAMEASVAGYAALGVGGSMTTAQFVLGYVSSGTATVKGVTASSKSGQAVSAGTVEVTSTDWASDASVTESGGKTVTHFTYNLAAGGKIANTASANLAWATAESDSVSVHSAKGTLTVNLDESVPTTPAPDTAAPTSAPPTEVPPAQTTEAPATDAPATTAPETAAPPTASPPTPEPQTPTTSETCVASTLPEYTCQTAVATAGTTVLVHWVLSEENTVVGFAVTANVTGYLSLGFGTQMVGSDIVLGWRTGEGVVSAMPYNLQAKSPTGVVAIETTWLRAGATVTQASGATTLTFSRTIAGSAEVLSLSAANLILAYHDTEAGVAFHSAVSVFTVRLTATPVSAPPTDVPETATPSSTCAASTLSLPSGEGTYECVSQLDAAVSLHWSVLSGSRKYALRGTAAGYLAMGFPNTPGSMGPGTSLIATGGSVAKYAIGSGKSSSDVQQSSTVLTEVTELTTGTVDGATVMHWTVTTATTSRTGVVQQSGDVLSFNYAYHTSSTSLTTHSARGSVEVNLLLGSTTDNTSASKKDKVKTHAVFQVLVWAYLVPLAVLAKRFGPLATTAKISTFPVPFVVHAVLMVIAVVLTVAMAGLALAQFDNGTEKGHKGTGIIVMSAVIVQLLMQVAKPAGDSPHRPKFRAVHVILGIVTMVLAYVTLFTGANNYKRLYASDEDFADKMVIAVIVGIAVFVLATSILSVVKFRKQGKVAKVLPDDEQNAM